LFPRPGTTLYVKLPELPLRVMPPQIKAMLGL
jgi:hypothetical protein